MNRESRRFSGWECQWVYREIALNAIRAFLPRPMLKLSGPGWVEATLHEQPAGDDHQERLLVHLVAYHPAAPRSPYST
jgi:hypothetical protein